MKRSFFRVKYNNISNKTNDIRHQLSSSSCIQDKARKEQCNVEPEEWPGPKKYIFVYLELLVPTSMLAVHDKLTCFYKIRHSLIQQILNISKCWKSNATYERWVEPQQVESQPSISKFLVSSLRYDANET